MSTVNEVRGTGAVRGRRRRLRPETITPLKALGILVVLAFVAFSIAPVLWTIALSLKPDSAVFSNSPVASPTLHNYGSAWSGGYPASLLHSAIIDVGATIVTMFVSLPGAYALVHQARFRIFRVLIGYNYLIRVLPGLILLLPLFYVFRTLHLLNSFPGMILAYQVFGIPIAMATLLGFFAEVPREVEEAAIVDGASTLQTFWKVTLPLVKGGAVAAAVLVFVVDWTEFLFALVLTGPQTETAPVAILNFLKYSNVDWGALAAATVMLILPSGLLGLATGRLFVRGLTTGAVK